MSTRPMVVVQKSGIKVKKSQKGFNYEVRYLTCQDLADPTAGYMFPMYRVGGEFPEISTYALIGVPFKEVKPAPVNDKYNLDMNGNPFHSIAWLNGFKTAEIMPLGQFCEKKVLTFNLQDVLFFSDHLEAKDGTFSIPSTDLGFPSFPAMFSKIKMEGTVTVAASFEHRLRRVNGEFIHRLEYKGGSIDLAACDLSHFTRVMHEVERDEAMSKFMHDLRTRLSRGDYLGIAEVQDMLSLAEIYGLTKLEIENLLYSATMHKEYEPAFFEALKKHQDPSTQIFYSDQGFVFRINGNWVWEEPLPARATYVFHGDRDVKILLSMLSATRRSDIRNVDGIQKVLGFKRAAIHPKDCENDDYMARWLSDINTNI